MTAGASGHGTELLCRRLEWDSTFFGLRIAELRPGRLSQVDAAAAVTWCNAAAVDCLYFLADADDPATIRTAEAYGFGLVDIRVTFSRTLEGEPVDPSPTLRASTSRDVPVLCEIARQAHTDSRFYADGRFPRERCDDLYATWIARSCDGMAETTLTVEHAGCTAGYVTCHLDDRLGRIGLVGVAPAARRQGVGRRLIAGALQWFRANGAARVEVVTQGRNAAAQRLYQTQGFTTALLQLWYHRWTGAAEMLQ